jgi:hypothetical protein
LNISYEHLEFFDIFAPSMGKTKVKSIPGARAVCQPRKPGPTDKRRKCLSWAEDAMQTMQFRVLPFQSLLNLFFLKSGI